MEVYKTSRSWQTVYFGHSLLLVTTAEFPAIYALLAPPPGWEGTLEKGGVVFLFKTQFYLYKKKYITRGEYYLTYCIYFLSPGLILGLAHITCVSYVACLQPPTEIKIIYFFFFQSVSKLCVTKHITAGFGFRKSVIKNSKSKPSYPHIIV